MLDRKIVCEDMETPDFALNSKMDTLPMEQTRLKKSEKTFK